MSVLDQLEPQSRAYVETILRAGGKPLQELSVEEARQFMRDRQRTPLEHPSIAVETTLAAGITLTIVRPAHLAGPLPAVLYMHGGGWVLGGIDTHARLVRELALRSNAAVVFPHFALSPESRFPVALDQCIAALKWLRAHAADHAIDPTRLAIAGDSAGANLAAAVALHDASAGPKLRLQALLCPVLLAPADSGSYAEFANGLNLTRDAMHWFWDHYIPDVSLRSDPRVSPLLASVDALTHVAPALVITAECDVLRDEGEAYAHRLTQSGVPVTAMRFLGVIHNFYVLDDLANSGPSQSALRITGDALQAALYS
ncbi:MAG TPA: alpha/beta hydrolase [Acidobacteriaceae bacterium]